MLLQRAFALQSRALATKAKRKVAAAAAATIPVEELVSTASQQQTSQAEPPVPVEPSATIEPESTSNLKAKKSLSKSAKPKVVSAPPASTALEQLRQQQRDALAIALSKIDKQFGKGTVTQLGSQPAHDTSRVISTGTLSLDDALGIGGLPMGRIVEIFGPEASGKTCMFTLRFF